MKAKKGDRVRLSAFEDNPVEEGLVIDVPFGDDTTYLIAIGQEYWDSHPYDDPDDGLREVTEDQIEAIL